MTTSGFWFLVDALNFKRVTETDLNDARQSIINSFEVDLDDLSEAQEHEFILKIRKLVSTEKGRTLNMADILSTNIDEVIEAAEQYQARISYENSKKIQ